MNKHILEVTKAALCKHTLKTKDDLVKEIEEQEQWEQLCQEAQNHAVLSLWGEVLTCEGYAKTVKDKVNACAQKIIYQNYYLLYETHRVCTILREHGIETAVLKGVATAALYPVPELRKSGDIDLLILRPEQLEEAARYLQEKGYVQQQKQIVRHHLSLLGPKLIEIELHVRMADVFERESVNQYLEQCMESIHAHVCWKNCMGYDFLVLSDGFHAFELLLHMLQHFLHAGFGLKLLCDWVVFWNRPIAKEEVQDYQRMVKDCGLQRFSDLITGLCVQYLGLSRDCPVYNSKINKKQLEIVCEEILEAEEFGGSKKEQMLVLKDTSLRGYLHGFHEQMCVNFPKESKHRLLWPVLWGITFVRFCKNNRTIRKVTFMQVMRATRRRSRLVKELKLFE